MGVKKNLLEDIFTMAETNADLAQVLGGLLLQVKAIGTEMDVL